MNGLRRHLAIIASTGSGKTWSSIILIEELLRKGATVLVIDPHGEYTHIRNSVSRLGPQFVDRVTIISASEGGTGDLRYRINLLRVQPDVLADVAGVPRGGPRRLGTQHTYCTPWLGPWLSTVVLGNWARWTQ
ncbi:DUF87 domain-containing protein [Vulcanisaeta souniana]|uniref:helicase HerA domain-containing protein n=1 Tax=Vulcanisaeta souniana TaxID=164452 RepID=UPI001FB4E5CE|nr:DUF87 domain-containing protein [Vulcanisaeta souniana]